MGGPIGLASKATLFISLLSFSCASYSQTIRIAVDSFAYEKYKAWAKDEPCKGNLNRSASGLNRSGVELLLICKYLKKANLGLPLQFVQANYERALRDVKSGEFDMMAQSAWDEDIDDATLLKTSPIEERGEYERGIYVAAEKLSKIKINSIEDLRLYKGVSNLDWRIDWKTLEDMKAIFFSVAKRESMHNLVALGRADYAVFDFSSKPDLSIQYGDFVLKPVPGIKIVLKSKRRFVISKKSKMAFDLQTAISEGLQYFSKNGENDRIWKSSGVTNQRTLNWKVLNK